MKTSRAIYMYRDDKGELQTEERLAYATSKSAAERDARNFARSMDWRLREVRTDIQSLA